jgi:hypothetical protein
MQNLHDRRRNALLPGILFVVLAVVLSFPLDVDAAVNPNSEQRKIAYLLDAIGASHLIFIRNGDEYTGEEARDHLQEKLDIAGGDIRTAEDFINYIASESSVSGISYYVRLPDGTQIEAGIWLRGKLAEMK